MMVRPAQVTTSTWLLYAATLGLVTCLGGCTPKKALIIGTYVGDADVRIVVSKPGELDRSFKKTVSGMRVTVADRTRSSKDSVTKKVTDVDERLVTVDGEPFTKPCVIVTSFNEDTKATTFDDQRCMVKTDAYAGDVVTTVSANLVDGKLDVSEHGTLEDPQAPSRVYYSLQVTGTRQP